MLSPELTASFADGKRIRARAWMLDAVFDVHSHPHLVSTNNDETAISQAYVTTIFDSRASYIGHNMKGLDLISFSLSANRLSMPNKNAVPVAAILHGTHEISLQTVQVLFCRMEGLWTSWTPLYFGPGTLYKALEDHDMYQTFLDTNSTFDPVINLRVDYMGNSGIRQATLSKNTERSRVWTFAGVIDSAQHPGRFNTYAIRHDYLRQRIVSENSVWDQSADAWEDISYAIQKDWPFGNQFRNTPVSCGPDFVNGLSPRPANIILNCFINDSARTDLASRGIAGHGCALEGFKIQVMRPEHPVHLFFFLAH
jgi:hypothetical protein